jgi:hypothetical protein
VCSTHAFKGIAIRARHVDDHDVRRMGGDGIVQHLARLSTHDLNGLVARQRQPEVAGAVGVVIGKQDLHARISSTMVGRTACKSRAT